MPDMIEYRGFTAFQSVYNNHVVIGENGRIVKHINTTKRQTEADLIRLIDEVIEEGGGVK